LGLGRVADEGHGAQVRFPSVRLHSHKLRRDGQFKTFCSVINAVRRS
jgi:hypothetical protein